MTGNLSELDDFEFRNAWQAMPDADKAALPRADRSHYVERYRDLTNWVDGAAGRLKNRGNGEAPPDPVIEAAESIPGVTEPHVVPPDDRVDDHKPRHNYLQWAALDGLEPPPFNWLLDHWLSWHPTLLAGRGGIGKSLLVQQLGTALACGLPTWCAAVDPVSVLYFACEDDHDQLWRREAAICKQIGIGLSALKDFHVDARYGMENTLLTTEFGRPMWTPQLELLREQVGDWRADILILDNLGHTFGANENVRHDVTLFLNGIAGLVTDRPFCPILLGHPSKAPNSEYSGSTAWENAVRMRWYLDDKLPDAHADPEATPDPDYRVLAKRKTNYTRMDYVQFRFNEGVLVPELQEQGEPGLMATLRKRKARATILSAISRLAEVKLYGNNTSGRYYLPHLILENKLGEGCTKTELADAMRELVMSKNIEMGDVGKDGKGRRIHGLKNT